MNLLLYTLINVIQTGGYIVLISEFITMMQITKLFFLKEKIWSIILTIMTLHFIYEYF